MFVEINKHESQDRLKAEFLWVHPWCRHLRVFWAFVAEIPRESEHISPKQLCWPSSPVFVCEWKSSHICRAYLVMLLITLFIIICLGWWQITWETWLRRNGVLEEDSFWREYFWAENVCQMNHKHRAVKNKCGNGGWFEGTTFKIRSAESWRTLISINNAGHALSVTRKISGQVQSTQTYQPLSPEWKRSLFVRESGWRWSCQ